MSANKLGIILLSGSLVFAVAAAGSAQQNNQNTNQKLSDLEDIRQVQQALTDLEYNPGEINGMLTSQTQQAVAEFQLFNNLPVTGHVDEHTKIALDSEVGTEVENAELSAPAAKSTDDETVKRAMRTEEFGSAKIEKGAAERIARAATVLEALTASSEKRVPTELLQRAVAIAVIPDLNKGAIGVDGRYGRGVIAERTDTGRWSTPAFIEIGAGSLGVLIGRSTTNIVLIFTDRKAMELLEDGKDLKLGVDAGVVAGPLGRAAEVANADLSSAIYAYSRSKGLFAGAAIDGAVLSMDNDLNSKVYGPSADTKQILNGRTPANATVRPFMDALDKVAPRRIS